MPRTHIHDVINVVVSDVTPLTETTYTRTVTIDTLDDGTTELVLFSSDIDALIKKE